MSSDREDLRAPLSLHVVAIGSLLVGIWSSFFVLLELMTGSIRLDPKVLGIPAFFGLRRFSMGWRTFAFLWTGYFLLTSAVSFLFSVCLVIFPGMPAPFPLRDREFLPRLIACGSGIVFLLAVWQYRVLTSTRVRQLFLGDLAETSAGSSGGSLHPSAPENL